jgi:hypothetical protein
MVDEKGVIHPTDERRVDNAKLVHQGAGTDQG